MSTPSPSQTLNKGTFFGCSLCPNKVFSSENAAIVHKLKHELTTSTDEESNIASKKDEESNIASRKDEESNIESKKDEQSNIENKKDEQSNKESKKDEESNIKSKKDKDVTEIHSAKHEVTKISGKESTMENDKNDKGEEVVKIGSFQPIPTIVLPRKPKCDICKMTTQFDDRSSFEMHLTMKHKLNLLDSDLDYVLEESKSARREKCYINSGKFAYKCNLCNRIYYLKNQLVEHVRKKHKNVIQSQKLYYNKKKFDGAAILEHFCDEHYATKYFFNYSEPSITIQKNVYKSPNAVFGCFLCPHEILFSKEEVAQHLHKTHRSTKDLSKDLSILICEVPVEKLIKDSPDKINKLPYTLKCICNHIIFKKDLLLDDSPIIGILLDYHNKFGIEVEMETADYEKIISEVYSYRFDNHKEYHVSQLEEEPQIDEDFLFYNNHYFSGYNRYIEEDDDIDEIEDDMGDDEDDIDENEEDMDEYEDDMENQAFYNNKDINGDTYSEMQWQQLEETITPNNYTEQSMENSNSDLLSIKIINKPICQVCGQICLRIRRHMRRHHPFTKTNIRPNIPAYAKPKDIWSNDNLFAQQTSQVDYDSSEINPQREELPMCPICKQRCQRLRRHMRRHHSY